MEGEQAVGRSAFCSLDNIDLAPMDRCMAARETNNSLLESLPEAIMIFRIRKNHTNDLFFNFSHDRVFIDHILSAYRRILSM
jgi:hypothetical protein